jgi:hypothetical protein
MTLLKTLAIAAALAMILTPANAAEVGNTLRFTTPHPLAAGCTDFDDAIQVKRIVDRYGWQYADLDVHQFVEWVGISKKRACIILNETSSDSDNWRIVKKVVPRTGPTFGNAWFCLESTIDYRPAREIAAERDYKERVKQAAEKAGRSPIEIERMLREIQPSAWGGADETQSECFWIWMTDKPLKRGN